MSDKSKKKILPIQVTQTLPIFTLKDAQTALQSQEDRLSTWIQDVHSPSLLELFELHKNIKSIKLLIAKIIGDNASLTERLSNLQSAYDQLLTNYNTVSESLAKEVIARERLQAEVSALKETVDELTGDKQCVEAAIIVRAAEVRFLDLLCSQAPKEWREYYSKVCDLEADILSGDAHESIQHLWDVYKERYWKKRDINRLLRDFSNTRATITYKEDRDVDYYRKLTEEQVRSTFSSAYFRESVSDPPTAIPDHLVQAALELHKLTATPIDSQSSENDGR